MQIKKIFSIAIAGVVIATAFPVLTSFAQPSESAPSLELYMVDTGANSPNLPGDCQGAGQRFGWGTWVRDTINNDNSDCAKVRITNPASRYTDDFRVCFSLGSGWDETTRCTPWASEGGGPIQTRTSTYDWAIGYMQIWTESRPLAAGGYIENVRVGIQWYELPDGGSCGASGGMQWASQSQPESNWTYGGARDNDPGCARIALEASAVAPYNAASEGSNLSGQTLTAGTQYTGASNFRVLMRNTGHTWQSTQEVRRTGNCDGYEPGPDEEDCTYTKVMTSPNVKLQRIDSEPFNFGTAPVRLSYEREVQVRHSSVLITFCEYQYPTNPGGGGPVILNSRVDNPLGISVASANVEMPIDEPPIEPTCIPYEEWVEVVTETPGSAIVAPAVGTFPIGTFTTPPANGEYTLRFRMVKTDGPSAGTDAQGFFGEVANVPVTIGGGSAGVGISCPVAELTVQAGQTASYAVSVSSLGGFAGQVQVTPSGMPSGATSPGATLTLAAGSSTSGIVPIMTAASTPAGTSTITFTATAPGVASSTCTSLLVVQGAGGAATLDVRPDTAQVDVGDQVTYSAHYDPDGSGPAPEQDVTANTATVWSSQTASANPLGAGRFEGVSPGSGTIRATYLSLSANASIDVTGTPSGTPTLQVRPGSATVDVGQSATYGAYFDPDGSGPSGETNVTNASAWSFSGTVASNDGSGRYTGLVPGSGTVRATYDLPGFVGSTVSATAGLTVRGSGLSCTFTANPMSLFIPPLRATTLSWSCDQPTSCVVTNVTRSRQVGTGNEAGSLQDRPAESTTYELNCGNGAFVDDLRVRVFDVTTRIEILPQ